LVVHSVDCCSIYLKLLLQGVGSELGFVCAMCKHDMKDQTQNTGNYI